MQLDKIRQMVQVAAGMRTRHRGFEPGPGLCDKLSDMVGDKVWEVRWGGDTAYLHLGGNAFICIPFNPVEARNGGTR